MAWLDLERVDEAEQIDDPGQPLPALSTSMEDLARVNRWFGGTHAISRHISHILRDVPRDRPARILDVATGSADVPLALAEWGRKTGRPVTIVAMDNSEKMLDIARARLAEASRGDKLPEGSVHLIRGDALGIAGSRRGVRRSRVWICPASLRVRGIGSGAGDARPRDDAGLRRDGLTPRPTVARHGLRRSSPDPRTSDHAARRAGERPAGVYRAGVPQDCCAQWGQWRQGSTGSLVRTFGSRFFGEVESGIEGSSW